MILGLRRISGSSMMPTYKDGQVVLVTSLLRPCVGQVVVARLLSDEVIKRVRAITLEGKYYLEGDNHLESIDSREYGAVPRAAVQGVIIYPRRK